MVKRVLSNVFVAAANVLSFSSYEVARRTGKLQEAEGCVEREEAQPAPHRSAFPWMARVDKAPRLLS